MWIALSIKKKVEATFENVFFRKIKKNFLTIKSTYLFLVRKNTKNAIFSINTVLIFFIKNTLTLLRLKLAKLLIILKWSQDQYY